MYKTQKARGLEASWRLTASAAYGYKVAPIHGVWPYLSLENVKERDIFGVEIFARPCPIEPRHGFVESRVVANIEELQKVIDETVAADNCGEVIVMDKLTGKYSAIMTATGVIWGQSHDGATSGRGEQRIIPTPAGSFDHRLLPALGKERMDDFGVYCELVENDGQVYITQMRLGPKQPDSRMKRYVVAANRIIKHIMKPDSDDLLRWAAKLESQVINRGSTLVHLPGQSLASHFAVQAIAKSYNVSVEDECPVDVGGVLTPGTGETAHLTEEDYAEMAEVFKADRKIRFHDHPRDVMQTVATLHSIPYWGRDKHLLALRVRGVVLAARYAVAACLGESRHKIASEMPFSAKTKVPWEKFLGGPIGNDKPSRNYVFSQAFALPWKELPKLAKAAAADMVLQGHPRVMDYLAKGGRLTDSAYASSFMGMKWEWAALKAHDLCIAINKFVDSPSEGNWGIMLSCYNEIINAAHNGGYLLNKWAAGVLIDNAATSPALVFGYAVVMNAVWNETEVIKDQSFCPWSPMPNAPPFENLKDYMKTSDGVFMPKVAYDQVIQCGGCDCQICIDWGKVGAVCTLQKLYVYLPAKVHDHVLNQTGEAMAAVDIGPEWDDEEEEEPDLPDDEPEASTATCEFEPAKDEETDEQP